MSPETTTRTYRKRARATKEQATRLRIAEAAMELHGSIGPARTTIKGVAERAGVQRATVYRHFPDEEALFAACSAHWYSLNPPPDPSRWAAIGDHDERLRKALEELYAWYAWGEAMLTNTMRDAPLVPSMRPAFEAFTQQVEALVATLVKGRPERGKRRARVAAAVGHAVAFTSWRSLVREGGVTDDEAIALMLATVAAAGAT